MAKPKATRPAPEPEITLRECLLEQLHVIADVLPEDRTVRDWYDDGADLDELIAVVDVDLQRRDEVATAYGYLRGAHEALDVTLSELLDDENISMDTLESIQ